MRILGIDPGSHTCGWAVATIGNGVVDVLDCGEITNHHKDSARRVRFIHKGLQEVLERLGPFDVLAYERPYNRAFGTDAIWLMIGAAITIPSDEVMLMHVKTIHAAWNRPAKMNREDGKKAAVEAANLTYNLNLAQDESDTADAVWVAVAAAKRKITEGKG